MLNYQRNNRLTTHQQLHNYTTLNRIPSRKMMTTSSTSLGRVRVWFIEYDDERFDGGFSGGSGSGISGTATAWGPSLLRLLRPTSCHCDCVSESDNASSAPDAMFSYVNKSPLDPAYTAAAQSVAGLQKLSNISRSS